ncbi:MAG: hypothetical protein LQ351_004358 [Letrouitia transgressa]|nr:MAG: hypothetical protein LQ351_004358 [Letrouitia transgressa]
MADKELYIPVMDSIYTAPEFTIIAYGSDGPPDGLPGVRAATRPRTQQVIEVDDLVLVSGLDSKDDSGGAQDPPWQQRAWTFQERLLSPRCLFFGSSQMQWECIDASFCEETEFETVEHGAAFFSELSNQSLFSWRLISQSKEEDLDHGIFNRNYSELAEVYSHRALSLDSDVLNALLGILNTLSDRTSIQFLWGLPCPLFEWDLLWGGSSGRKRIHCGFPSWSWLGYQNADLTTHPRELEFITAIRCYKRTYEPLDRDEILLSIQPVSDKPSYDPYKMRSGTITASKARAVEISDIPVAVVKYIRPNFHVIFWTDTTTVKWWDIDDPSSFPGFGTMMFNVENVKRSAINDERNHFPSGVIDNTEHADWTMDDTGIAEDINTDNPKHIGIARLNAYYRSYQSQTDCEVVRIFNQDWHARSKKRREKALLTIERNGIAERIGFAELKTHLIDRLLWKQRLVILG